MQLWQKSFLLEEDDDEVEMPYYMVFLHNELEMAYYMVCLQPKRPVSVSYTHLTLPTRRTV